jgi:hypothetical protein
MPSRRRRLGVEPLEDRVVPTLFAANTVRAIGSGVGGGEVRVTGPYAGETGDLRLFPFGPDFVGGVAVALADLSGDGVADVIVGMMSGGSEVKVIDGGSANALVDFRGTARAELLNFQAFETGFAGGVSLSAGQLTDDTTPDLIVGAGNGGGPVVKVFDGRTGSLVRSFFAFAPDFRGGVSVAGANLDNDRTDDIVVGAGAGGGPHVKGFSGVTGAETLSFFAFDVGYRGGVGVAADLPYLGVPRNPNLTAQQSVLNRLSTIVAGAAGSAPHVKVFGADGVEQRSFFAYPGTGFGVNVATADITGGFPPDFVVAAGPGGPASVKLLEGKTLGESPLADVAGASVAAVELGTSPAVALSSTVPDVNAPQWQTRADGLKTWDVRTGTGAAVPPGATVGVYYTGWLASDGTQIVSNATAPTPGSFPLSGLIRGWQEGLVGMQVGGIRRLYIPAALGYGSGGSSAIPPGADLVFEVRLVSVS